MIKPKKPTIANKRPSIAKKQGAVVIGLAMERAKVALQNEDTRQMLVDNSKAIAAQLQQWLNDHKQGGVIDVEPSWLGERFGQGKLERRVESLAATIDSLSTGRPGLIVALGPVSEAVVQIRTSVEIAGRLPIVKRKQAHLRLGRKIDELQEMLFEASLQS